MYEIESSLAEALSDYQQLISNYPAFYMVALAVIVLGLLLLLNMNTVGAYYMTLASFLGVIAASFYFRGMELLNHFDSIFSSKFYLNIYFFYWNMIIAALVIHFILNSRKQGKYTKIVVVLFFIVLAVNVIFSYYITGSMRNMYLLVLRNITPMIFIGNIVAMILYVYLIILGLIKFFRKE